MSININDLAKNFGKKVQIERIKQDIPQDELAFRAEIHRTTLSAIERGKTPPNLITIAKIANALNLSLEELLNLKF